MAIPKIRKTLYAAYHRELYKQRARQNYFGFLALSAILLIGCTAFLLQNIIAPNEMRYPWLAIAYSIVYVCGLSFSAVLMSLLLLMYRQRKSNVINLTAVFFSFAIIAIGVALTTLDCFSWPSLTSMFIASLGICIMLSAESRVYFFLEAWLCLLFGVSYVFILRDFSNPGIILSVSFLVVSSLVMGLYLERSRDVMQILSFELESRNRELKDALVRDPLTGAYNRLFLDEYLAKQMRIMKRYGDSMSILMFDIDHFKKVNDSLGHPAGDSVLRQFVSLVLRSVRDSDVVARTGGEEFLVMLPRTSWENSLVIAEKLRASIAQTPFDGVPWPITASIGVGVISGADTLETALSRIDAALYIAKKGGRNRVEGVKPDAPEGAFPVEAP